ncbi:hypothetical protein [Bifidobacterium olomucense]|uniref:Uncharacterized protein n=1 Tax=Bifidobacterium olomucense TaxID=2675324 RepID=A0A7Y0EW98_9BIFI|nr:hypothetical protein [Bifidobacterium sp. DSM 109959]NMM97583.1 hypothetical protein [Bifidobacterium sp. DSM 109959]
MFRNHVRRFNVGRGLYTDVKLPDDVMRRIGSGGEVRVGGIDLGEDNVATLTTNVTDPVMVSAASYWAIISHADEMVASLDWTREQAREWARRSKARWLNLMTSALARVILDIRLDVVVIGYNPDWKNGTGGMKQAGMGDDANVTGAHPGSKRDKVLFQQIPYRPIINLLASKLMKHHVTVIITTESYTSKTDYAGLEPMADEYHVNRTPLRVLTNADEKKLRGMLNHKYAWGTFDEERLASNPSITLLNRIAGLREMSQYSNGRGTFGKERWRALHQALAKQAQWETETGADTHWHFRGKRMSDEKEIFALMNQALAKWNDALKYDRDKKHHYDGGRLAYRKCFNDRQYPGDAKIQLRQLRDAFLRPDGTIVNSDANGAGNIMRIGLIIAYATTLHESDDSKTNGITIHEVHGRDKYFGIEAVLRHTIQPDDHTISRLTNPHKLTRFTKEDTDKLTRILTRHDNTTKQDNTQDAPQHE